MQKTLLFPTFWSSPKNIPSLQKIFVSLQFILNQYIIILCKQNFNLLSKPCNLHLKYVTFCRRALFAMQKNRY